MSIRRFYTERQNLRVGSSVRLPDDEAEHIRKSLRMSKGDIITLFNGDHEYQAELTLVTNNVAMAEITKELEVTVDKEQPKFTLFLSLIRIPNLELVLQKATELGVSRIVPLETEFSQIKLDNLERKFDRWQKIILEACKQSERSTIPELMEPLKFEQIPKIQTQFDKLLFFSVPRIATQAMAKMYTPQQALEGIKDSSQIGYMIGPEGGFSPTEHKLAAEWGLTFVKLGATVLKSETAAIAAQAVLNNIVD